MWVACNTSVTLLLIHRGREADGNRNSLRLVPVGKEGVVESLGLQLETIVVTQMTSLAWMMDHWSPLVDGLITLGDSSWLFM